jgi:hypothetical protein
VHLDEEEVEQIVKFFFYDVFGAGACQRVAKLVKYAEGEILGTDHGAGQRATALAEDEAVPIIYHTFFRSFRTVHGDEHPATSYYKRVQHH